MTKGEITRGYAARRVIGVRCATGARCKRYAVSGIQPLRLFGLRNKPKIRLPLRRGAENRAPFTNRSPQKNSRNQRLNSRKEL